MPFGPIKLLTYALIPVVVNRMQRLHDRAALREPPLDLPEGGFRMRMPRFTRYSLGINTLVIAVILGSSLWGMRLRVAAIVMVLLLLALTVVWTQYTTVDVTREGLTARRMFRPTRHLPWSEIARAEWKPVTVRWLLTDRAGRVLKIARHLTGRPQLAEALLARCPRNVSGWKEQ